MESVNQVRAYHFLLGVLRSQQSDPFCKGCSAFVNTINAVREGLMKFEGESAEDGKNPPEDIARLFADAKAGLSALKLPDNPRGQKKAGNCKLPEGVCFVKLSLALIRKV